MPGVLVVMLAPVINFLDLPADMQQNIVDALNIYEASTWAKVSKSGRQFVKGRMECVLALTHYPFNMGINELYTINKIRVTGIELNDIITLTKALTSGGLANLKELRVFNILGLAENQAGDDGLKALAEPLSKGALDNVVGARKRGRTNSRWVRASGRGEWPVPRVGLRNGKPGRTALGYRGHTICFAAKSHDLFCSKNMSHTESECLSGSYFL